MADFDPDQFIKENNISMPSGGFNPDQFMKDNNIPQPPNFLTEMGKNALNAVIPYKVPMQSYEATKKALGDLWEKENQKLEAQKQNPSNALTDWMNPDFLSVPAAAVSPFTEGIKKVVSGAAYPIAKGMQYGLQTVGPEAARLVNPNPKLPTDEEVFNKVEPDVETALGLVMPRYWRNPPPAAPPPPKADPFGITLTPGEESGDLPTRQAEQAALRADPNGRVYQATKPFREQREQQISDSIENVAKSLDEANSNVAMSPLEAAQQVSQKLGEAEEVRSADVAEQGESLRRAAETNMSDPRDSADTIAQAMGRTSGDSNVAINGEKEAIRQWLNPNGEVIANSPQEAGDIMSAGVTRAEEQATELRDAAYQRFSEKQGSVDPKALANTERSIRTDLNNPDDMVILNEKTTPNAIQAIDTIKKDIGDPATLAADPKTKSFKPFTPASIDNVRKKLVAFSKQANAEARASNDYSDVRAMGRVMDAFDNVVSSAFRNNRMLSGDGPDILDAWQQARAAHAKLRQTFSPQGKGDIVGPIINKILGARDGQAAPANQIADWLTGKGAMPVLLGRRLLSIFGQGSPEISAVKQALWSKITEAPEGMTPLTNEKIADNIYDFINGKGRELSRLYFTPEDLARMRAHADNLRDATNLRAVGPETTGQEFANDLFGRDGMGSAPKNVKNAQYVKDTYGENSRAFNAYKQGQLSAVIRGTNKAAFDHADVADRLDKFLDSDMAKTLFSDQERQVLGQYRDALNAHAERAALPTDKVERAISRITGRDGSAPASAKDVADMIYGRSTGSDKTVNLNLVRRLKDIFGESSPQWTAVRQGMFRQLVDRGEGMKDWTPGKVADRIHTFLNQSPELAAELYSPSERAMLRSYGDTMRKMEVPQAGVNWSGTARPVVGAIKRNAARFMGMIVGGHIFPKFGDMVGLAAGHFIGKLSEIPEAAQARKLFPIVADRLNKWQQAADVAQRLKTPPYKTMSLAAAQEASNALSQLGINLPGIARATANEENNKQPGPQQQKRNGGAVNQPSRAHGGKVTDSRSSAKFHPRMIGAKQAPDGHWYIRGHKGYLRVVPV